MTDIFASEILSLVILIPVILRPFSRRLQRMDGVPLLAAVSFLLLTLSVVAFGLPVSHLPAVLCSFAFFLASSHRLVRLGRGLPTDWYGLPSRVLYAFLSLVWLAAFSASVAFAGESSLVPGESALRERVSERVGPGERATFVEWSPGAGSTTQARGLVLFVGDLACGAEGRQTAAQTLANEGFAVMSLDLRLPFARGTAAIALPQARRLYALLGRIMTGREFVLDENGRSSVHRSEFHRLIVEASRRYPAAFDTDPRTGRVSLPLFVLLEGSSVSPVLDAISLSRVGTSGVLCLLPESEAAARAGRIPRRDPPWFVARVGESEMTPNGADGADILFLTSAPEGLFGHGEIACDDVLAARLLGGTRDVQRVRAERAGRRIASWFTLRAARVAASADVADAAPEAPR